MADKLGSYEHRVNLRPASQITDRAKRYRARKNVPGPKRCVVCNSASDLQAMHLSGDESDGGPENLAWGCRSCNQVLSAAYIALGSTVRTAQYNPAGENYPTFEQYAWAVSNHESKAYDEGGAIIHATPRHLRIKYARRLAEARRRKRRASRDEVPF